MKHSQVQLTPTAPACTVCLQDTMPMTGLLKTLGFVEAGYGIEVHDQVPLAATAPAEAAHPQDYINIMMHEIFLPYYV